MRTFFLPETGPLTHYSISFFTFSPKAPGMPTSSSGPKTNPILTPACTNPSIHVFVEHMIQSAFNAGLGR